VFVGGFSLDAAGYVAAQSPGATDRGAFVETVAALVDQSLVERVGDAAETRFTMLETIREYGITQLADRGDLESANDAHATYYQKMAAQAEPGLRGPDQVAWLGRLEVEHGNLREALAWLTSSDRVPEAVELFSNIVHYMMVHAHFTEWRELLDGWFATPALSQPTRTRALALFAEGFATANLGEPASAIGPLQEAVELFRKADDSKWTVFTLSVFSYALWTSGDTKRAQIANDESLALAHRTGDARDVALATMNLANISWQEGDVQRARLAMEESLAIARRAGDTWMVSTALSFLERFVIVVDGDVSRAQVLIEESRVIDERLEDKRNLPVTLLELAAIARAQGNFDTAMSYLGLCLTTAKDTGQVLMEAQAHLHLGSLARLQHDVWNSVRELRTSICLFQESSFLPDVTDCLDEFAALALASGDASAAARFLGASDGLIRDTNPSPALVRLPEEHDQLMERARTELGEETFDLLHAETEGWSVDDAVAAAQAFELPADHTEPTKESERAHGLSPRELDVLKLMANGLSNQHIADELFLSRRTVTSYVTGILGKLELTSRTQAVSFAIRSGIA